MLDEIPIEENYKKPTKLVSILGILGLIGLVTLISYVVFKSFFYAGFGSS